MAEQHECEFSCECGRFLSGNEYETLKKEHEALREYALSLMTGPYIGMDREQRELILESELIALYTEDDRGN